MKWCILAHNVMNVTVCTNCLRATSFNTKGPELCDQLLCFVSSSDTKHNSVPSTQTLTKKSVSNDDTNLNGDPQQPDCD
jgi:hypothetical protein